MSTDLIVSYDGTPNDDDALALGRMLSRTGATLALAYVRHSREFDPQREEVAQHDAERRLESGAVWLGQPEIPRHVVISGSTGTGLEELAVREGASVVVFGSDYRTPPGRTEPGTSAQRLLDGGPVAVAVAAAGLRAIGNGSISSITMFAPDTDAAARQTAEALAARLGASLVGAEGGSSDLIVVGSAPGRAPGKTGLSGRARSLLNSARGSVLVVPSGKPLGL